jgi:glycosyltransferase involved in cell wall biosynthesis
MPDSPLDFAALQPTVGVFGGVRRFLELGNELVARGHRFVLYHPEGTTPEWLPFRGEVRALAELREHTHQIALCNAPSILAEFEAASAKLKMFYCVLEKIEHERHIVRHPGWTILANSTGILQRLWRRHRVRAEPVIGGVRLDVFHPGANPSAPGAARPFRVLAYGRFSRKRKGAHLVVGAAARVLRTLRRRQANRSAAPSPEPLQLVLFDHVGAGNETDPRQALPRNLPLEFHLNLSQSELARLYASCDVFVSAERRAGWCNTVAEAMACGTPVVCTRSGTLDVARHRETAWVVRWRHPFFLARGMLALHSDPHLRDQLQRHALERVRAFSWHHVADQLESVARRRLATL